MGAIDEHDSESIEISKLKDNIIELLGERFFTSITQLHWIATFLDPSFKSFSFLPNSTPADRKFKRDLLKDLPGWLATLDQATSGATHESLPAAVSSFEISETEIEEPPKKKTKSFFASMRDNSQPSKHTQDTALSLQEEYEMYLTGEATSDYDEDNPLTYWATVHRRLPILGNWFAKSYVVRPLRTIRTRFFTYRTHKHCKENSSFAQICVGIRIYCFSPSRWTLLKFI